MSAGWSWRTRSSSALRPTSPGRTSSQNDLPGSPRARCRPGPGRGGLPGRRGVDQRLLRLARPARLPGGAGGSVADRGHPRNPRPVATDLRLPAGARRTPPRPRHPGRAQTRRAAHARAPRRRRAPAPARCMLRARSGRHPVSGFGAAAVRGRPAGRGVGRRHHPAPAPRSAGGAARTSGVSLVNAVTFIRGHESGHDAWARSGVTGWGPRTVALHVKPVRLPSVGAAVVTAGPGGGDARGARARACVKDGGW
jgi:hypothetical protein